MPSVELEFLPPGEQNITTLHVEEAPAQGGPFVEVQIFPAGVYPTYIRSVVVTSAISTVDWFRIRWEDNLGSFTPYSDPIQGGTTTVVSQVMDRVILRDSSIAALIAGQEAEAVVSDFFGVADPYLVDPSLVTPKILSGLTMLALARAYMTRSLTASQASKWTAGLVTMDQSTSGAQSWANIDKLIEMANRDLGRSYSVILLMKEYEVAGGQRRFIGSDVSRSLLEVEIL